MVNRNDGVWNRIDLRLSVFLAHDDMEDIRQEFVFHLCLKERDTGFSNKFRTSTAFAGKVTHDFVTDYLRKKSRLRE